MIRSIFVVRINFRRKVVTRNLFSKRTASLKYPKIYFLQKQVLMLYHLKSRHCVNTVWRETLVEENVGEFGK